MTDLLSVLYRFMRYTTERTLARASTNRLRLSK